MGMEEENLHLGLLWFKVKQEEVSDRLPSRDTD